MHKNCFPQVIKKLAWSVAIGWIVAAVALLVQPSSSMAQEPAATAATIWYVDGANGVDGTCTTAGAPCRTIQAAIDRAANGDTVLVATGTYTFGGGNSCTAQTGAPAVVCVFSKQIVLRGGFASGNFVTSNPSQTPTIIDGQSQNRGIFVLSFERAGAALDMAGFTVRNGLGTGISKRPAEDSYFGYGGGLFAENASTIILRTMRFENNRAVGSDRGSGPGGAGVGGAISLRTTQAASLEGVTFSGNQALGGSGAQRGGSGQGGALFTFGTTMTGSNLVFDGNLAQGGNSSGGGTSSDGERAEGFGGAATFQEGSKVTLNNVVARNNKAIGGNAGVLAGGGFGGAFMGEVAEISINGADIRNNLAQGGNAQNGWFGNGGGLMTIHSTVNINRALIIANTAQGGNGSGGNWGLPNGGGVMVTWVNNNYGSKLNIANSIIADNKAVTGQGGEIVIGGGGGLWIQATDAVIDHSTIANNQLSGGGLFGAGIQALNTGGRGANVTIRHSLLTGHTSNVGSAVEALVGNSVTFAGGLFFGNTYNSSNDNAIVGGNRGSINGQSSMAVADPLYLSPAAPDYDYHLKAQSPARNKASSVTQSVDVDSEERNDGTPDYGADEYAAPARAPVAYYGLTANRNSITLAWDLDPNLAGDLARYRLTYSYTPSSGGAQVTQTVDVGKQTSYTLRNLQPLVIYTITIDALNAANAVLATGGSTSKMTTDINMHLPRITR